VRARGAAASRGDRPGLAPTPSPGRAGAPRSGRRCRRCARRAGVRGPRGRRRRDTSRWARARVAPRDRGGARGSTRASARLERGTVAASRSGSGPEDSLDQSPREGEVGIRPDPEPLRQLHREPALHPAALHRDALAREGVAARLADDLREGVDEALGAIAPVDVHRPSAAELGGSSPRSAKRVAVARAHHDDIANLALARKQARPERRACSARRCGPQGALRRPPIRGSRRCRRS
jgi:hypothetical protein